MMTMAAVAAVIRVCRKRGWVARPQPNRWHKGTPAKFGGVSIWLVVLAISVCVIPASNRTAWVVLGLASLMFALGLVDDIVQLRPGPKLFAQCCVAALSIACGVALSVPGHPVLGSCLCAGLLG